MSKRAQSMENSQTQTGKFSSLSTAPDLASIQEMSYPAAGVCDTSGSSPGNRFTFYCGNCMSEKKNRKAEAKPHTGLITKGLITLLTFYLHTKVAVAPPAPNGTKAGSPRLAAKQTQIRPKNPTQSIPDHLPVFEASIKTPSG